jgi:protein TonB
MIGEVPAEAGPGDSRAPDSGTPDLPTTGTSANDQPTPDGRQGTQQERPAVADGVVAIDDSATAKENISGVPGFKPPPRRPLLAESTETRERAHRDASPAPPVENEPPSPDLAKGPALPEAAVAHGEVQSAARSDDGGRNEAAIASPPRYGLPGLANPRPDYPWLSRRRGEEGRVVLRVTVDAEGSAAVVEVAASSGHDRLDRAALAAVRRWRFAPARQGGKAIPGTVAVLVTFRLIE